QFSRFGEEAGAPEWLAKRKAPFRGPEALLQLSNLNDPDRGRAAARNDGETHVITPGAMLVGPRNETFEPFNGRRRRRHEPGDLVRRQQTQQRRGVGPKQV